MPCKRQTHRNIASMKLRKKEIECLIDKMENDVQKRREKEA